MGRAKTGLEVQETDDSLLISWDNRTAALQFGSGCLILAFFVPWTLITLFLTLLTLISARGWALAGFVPFTACFWIGMIAMGRCFFDRRLRESIEVTSTAVTCKQAGRFARRPRVVPLADVDEIYFGYSRLVKKYDPHSTGMALIRRKHGFIRNISLVFWLSERLQRE
ncbi:MAG TPA: hypothetical protein VGG30_00695, partial [Pirellulales bacterium]